MLSGFNTDKRRNAKATSSFKSRPNKPLHQTHLGDGSKVAKKIKKVLFNYWDE